MSEHIDNRKYRKEIIKKIISQLHEGKSVEEVKGQFAEAFEGVSASEISEAEQALIMEGLPVSEVQRLCDVHSAVFKGSIEEIHQLKDQTKIPGHPANVLVQENSYIKKVIEENIKPHIDALDKNSKDKLIKALENLAPKIYTHYLKKENLLFPYMERYGITAPPKVMWGVDDEIRALFKKVKEQLSMEILPDDSKQNLTNLIQRVSEMVFKEENILLPMLTETLTQDEWKEIARESEEIGHIVDNVPVWSPVIEQKAEIKKAEQTPDSIKLPSGVFNIKELTYMLNTLPFDITFVDKNDTVKYFSQSKERIFPRTTSIIGRKVTNCHPPASVEIVEKIVSDFKSGKKDHEDFWINMGDKMVYIRYFAVRSEDGEYLGVVEVTQNIKPIKEITGEKRLVED